MYGYPQESMNSHNRHLGHHLPPAPPPLRVPDRISHQNSQQPVQYIIPQSHHLPPAHQPPPLPLVGSMSQQTPQLQQQHQQPSEMTPRSESEKPRSKPAPFSTVADGRIWELEVCQQPVRARMCGFGDKDRRPVTPPPCIRLVVRDQQTGKEVNVNDIDTSYYVLTVDIWDEHGRQETNIVKTANGNSPSISSASAAAYPPASANPPQPPPPPSAMNFYSPSSAQPASANSYQSMGSYQGGYGSAPSSAYSQQYSPQQFPPRMNSYTVPPAPNGYHNSLPSPTTPMGPYPTHAASSQHYSQPPSNQAPNPSFQITRNLIGSLSASAFRLYDNYEKQGVWFVMQDLSVRTEGNFRLKFNFMNLSELADSASCQNGPSQQKQQSNDNSATTPSSPHTVSAAANSSSASQRPNQAPATQHNTALNKGFAPVLAYAFSEPFTVYSAKRFPGVIESTDLSRTFAAQGIKIPIRKDNDQKNGNGKRGRGGDDDDEDGNGFDEYDDGV